MPGCAEVNKGHTIMERSSPAGTVVVVVVVVVVRHDRRAIDSGGYGGVKRQT